MTGNLVDDSEPRARAARFSWDEMDAHFVRMLEASPAGTGLDRIEKLADRAEAYFERVAGLDPELPLVSAFE